MKFINGAHTDGFPFFSFFIVNDLNLLRPCWQTKTDTHCKYGNSLVTVLYSFVMVDDLSYHGIKEKEGCFIGYSSFY